MPANTYDAIVVGSGITGGWAAKELSEKGLRTLVLKPDVPSLPKTIMSSTCLLRRCAFAVWATASGIPSNNPSSRLATGMDEWNSKFFVNDRENPYTTEPGKPFLLDSRTPGRRTFPHLGPPILSLE